MLKNILKKIVCVMAFSAVFNAVAFAEEIKVLGAASLRFVLEEIKSEFLKNRPNDKIDISYISSGKAYAQIENGAPVHLFIAADTSYPKKLYEKNLAKQKERVYARGALVLWSNNKNFKLKNFEDILNEKIKNIALPNPKVAPYGRAAIQAMEKKGYLKKLESKFALGDSIGQATSLAETNAAEVGFSALSMLDYNNHGSGIKSKEMSFVIIDSSLYEPIDQALIIPKHGENSKLAKDFADYIFSPFAKSTFEKFGYK